MTDDLLGRLTEQSKNGKEELHDEGKGLGVTVLDFWQWSASDLVSNATRGVLAEFIVAQALGVPTDRPRDEWAAFDLVTPEGVIVEVKSAAFVQSWSQRENSTVRFPIGKTAAWNAETGLFAGERKRQADVYVFALLAHKDKSTLDPLNVAQWRFYVLASTVLEQRMRNQKSIAVGALEKLGARALGYFELASAVRSAFDRRP